MLMGNDNGFLKYISLIWGLFYLAAGSVQLLKGIGILPEPFISSSLMPPAIAGGLVMLVVAAVFLFGFLKISKDTVEGHAFAYAGILLGMVFGAVYFLDLLADMFNFYILASEDYAGWKLIDSFKPALYLGILSLIVYAGFKNTFVSTSGRDA